MTSITASQDRNLRTGSRLTGIGAAAFIGYAVVFFILNFTDRFLELGIGPEQVEVGRSEIQAFSPSLFHYISHLHIALPAHYPNGFDTVAHLGPIYLATATFVVGALLALRAIAPGRK
ncbi:MAG: hypothetical protein ACT4OP_00355 [Actinomycetota bacterium]